MVAYLLPLLLAGVLSAAIAAFAWRRRPATGSIAFALFMTAVAVWSLGYALELGSADTEIKIFWAGAQYLGIATVAPLWLVFVVQYTGRGHWLAGRRLALLALVPLLTIGLAWTNRWHGLIWSSITLVPLGQITALELGHGLWFWVFVAWTNTVLATGAVLFVRSVLRRPPMYRAQASVLLLGTALPWLGNIVYLSGNSPLPNLDITPFAFALSGVTLALGLYRFHLLDVVPVARDTVFESMSDGVIVLDMQQRVVDINPAAQAIVEHSAAQLIGQPISALIAHRPDLIARFQHMLAGDATLSIGPPERRRTFHLRISPLYNHYHHLIGRVLVLHDITEQRRTAEQLRQAKEAAEAANRTKSAFLANVSHELRTPLTAILGYSELMALEASRLGDDRMIRDLTAVRAAGQHLLMLINNVLDLSKIEAGKLELYPELFSVATLLSEVERTVVPLVRNNGSSLQVECADPGAVMCADLTKVRQILFNLLSNAAKFTERGSIQLRVWPEKLANHSWLHFQVSDTGIGITPEHMNRLFEEYDQGGESVSHRYGGSGLGLALTRHFCRLLGGDIAVASEVGAGTTFTVSLPVGIEEG